MDTEIESSYQDTQKQEDQPIDSPSFATIAGIYEDGAALIFDGETEPSQKHYRANLYCKFEVGQRVYVAKDNGTYVVLFPIGIPGSVGVTSDASKYHTGDTISFFGGSPVEKKYIAKLKGTVTAADVGNKVNELLNALFAYGLLDR